MCGGPLKTTRTLRVDSYVPSHSALAVLDQISVFVVDLHPNYEDPLRPSCVRETSMDPPHSPAMAPSSLEQHPHEPTPASLPSTPSTPSCQTPRTESPEPGPEPSESSISDHSSNFESDNEWKIGGGVTMSLANRQLLCRRLLSSDVPSQPPGDVDTEENEKDDAEEDEEEEEEKASDEVVDMDADDNDAGVDHDSVEHS